MYHRQVFNRYLTDREESMLFRTVRKFSSIYARRDHAWMMLVRQTGIRVTPLSLLTVSDAKRALHEDRLHIRADTNKGGHGHSVHLNKTAARMLRELLAVRRLMGYADVLDGPLIVSRNHKRMSVRSYQSRMSHWARQAGLTLAASPHWLRHTFAKRIVQHSTSTEPLPIAQHALGHADINSTAIYTYPDKEALEETLDLIG